MNELKGDFIKEKKEDLLNIMPKFIKHIFIDYIEKDSSKEKFLDLVSFCEAFSAFLFCITNASEDADLKNIDLDNNKIDNSMDLRKGVTFGFWSSHINYENLFEEGMEIKKMKNFIEKSRDIRNRSKGHGGVANDYNKDLKELEDNLFNVYDLIFKIFKEFEVFKVVETNLYRNGDIEYKKIKIKNNYLEKETIFQSDLGGFYLFKNEYYIKGRRCIPNFIIIDEIKETMFILSRYETEIDFKRKSISEYIIFKNYSNKNFDDEVKISGIEFNSFFLRKKCNLLIKEKIENEVNKKLKEIFKNLNIKSNNSKIDFKENEFNYDYEFMFNKKKNAKQNEKEKESYFKKIIEKLKSEYKNNAELNNINIFFNEKFSKMVLSDDIENNAELNNINVFLNFNDSYANKEIEIVEEELKKISKKHVSFENIKGLEIKEDDMVVIKKHIKELIKEQENLLILDMNKVVFNKIKKIIKDFIKDSIEDCDDFDVIINDYIIKINYKFKIENNKDIFEGIEKIELFLNELKKVISI